MSTVFVELSPTKYLKFIVPAQPPKKRVNIQSITADAQFFLQSRKVPPSPCRGAM